jgi:hypothetical protein
MDVVWCRFPYDEKPGVPGVTPHPGLVFAVNEYKPGLFSVRVAYGTSNLKTESRPHDLRIGNFRAMQHAGLYQATRFDLDRLKWLMWDDAWFVSPDPDKYPTPKIGSLLSDSADRLRRCIARRQKLGLPVP